MKIRLSTVEAEVLACLTAGERRSDIAKSRGVSRARISVICRNIGLKGHRVPEPIPYETPHIVRALDLYQRGYDDRAVAEVLGVSPAWALQMRLKLIGRGDLPRRIAAYGPSGSLSEVHATPTLDRHS